MNNKISSFSARELIHAFIWYKRHITNQNSVSEILIIRQFLKADSVCFDVGAHAGFWTKPLSKVVTKGHVYAFESLPYYARVLGIVVKLLRLRNVTVVNKAVFDKPASVSLAWKNQNGKRLTGLTHIAAKQNENTKNVTIEAITLDSLLSDLPSNSRVAFIKMDIEGCEYMAVRGAVKLIETFRPIFYLEIETSHCQRYGYKPADLFKFFTDFDYKAYTISLSNEKPITKATGATSYQGNGNVLFVPSEHIYCRCYNKS